MQPHDKTERDLVDYIMGLWDQQRRWNLIKTPANATKESI